jgi:voltage-gated potassium channel
MPETRLERRLDRLIARAQSPRNAAIVIATVTTAITIASGLLMSVADHDGFPTVWGGLWWAVQTVTTVGYGDHVPTTPFGQFIAAGVMLLGIGFVTVITASITGAFVSRGRVDERMQYKSELAEALQQIDERLARIEAAMTPKA